MVSNVVGEAQLPISHEQARQKFEFHKNTHRNEKELRFTLLYSENREVSRLNTEKIKRIPPNYDKEQRQKICSDLRLARKVLIAAECQKTHSQKSELNAFP